MIFIFLLVAITIIFALSYFANVPYIYTILGFSIWMFIAHLVTLDDDMKDGWSNPENLTKIWKSSKLELFIKFLVVITLLIILFAFPSLKEF